MRSGDIKRKKECATCLYRPPCNICTYESRIEHNYYDRRHKILCRSQAIKRGKQSAMKVGMQMSVRMPLSHPHSKKSERRKRKFQEEVLEELEKQKEDWGLEKKGLTEQHKKKLRRSLVKARKARLEKRRKQKEGEQ